MIEQNFVVGNVGIKLLDLRDVRVQDSNVSLEIGFTWWTGVTTPPPSPCKDQIVWLVCGREELKNDRERVSAFWGASLLAIPLRPITSAHLWRSYRKTVDKSDRYF